MPKLVLDDVKNWPPERFLNALRDEDNISPVDALLETQADLSVFEQRYNMTSREFYARFKCGELGDASDYILWAGLYEAFSLLKQRVENAVMDVTVQRSLEPAVA